jgi:cytochrome c biogenesis protein
MGPSFVYRLRDETGFAREYETYMLPLKQGDRYYFLSGVRSQPSEDFRFLHIPVDPSGRIDRFMRLLAYIHSPDLVRQVAEVTTDQAMNRTGIDGDGLATQISGSMAQLVLLFAEGGFDALARHVEASVPEAERPQATQAFIRVLQTGMGGVYRQLLLDEGITEPTERDWLFLEDAITAVGALPNYGSPYFMQLADFNQIEASGLQITKSPGKNIVYFGSIVLTIGIFLLFYMAHQRVWVWLGPREEGGGTEMVLAGVSNRNMLEFEKRFAAVKGTMFAGLKPVDAHTQPDNGPTEPDGANRS